jgi:hypothetical protein
MQYPLTGDRIRKGGGCGPALSSRYLQSGYFFIRLLP